MTSDADRSDRPDRKRFSILINLSESQERLGKVSRKHSAGKANQYLFCHDLLGTVEILFADEPVVNERVHAKFGDLVAPRC
jgi:ABC-type uncharacterized transport system ATPase subunit